MTKEIYISSTPHETRLALVEDDKLAEIYYERENEYTLAGSIYKGRVTRVLPGMQSAFVDVGLERDAFLYVTDFVEENEDGEEYIPLPAGQAPQENRRNEPRSDSRNNNRGAAVTPNQTLPATPENGSPSEGDTEASGDQDPGARRWRGRRGRRRGPQDRNPNRPGTESQTGAPVDSAVDPIVSHESAHEAHFAEQPQQPEVFSPERRSFDRPSADRPSSNRPSSSDRRRSESPREHRGSSYDAPSGAAPMILPGESLSKYRRGKDPAPAASAPAASHSAAAPVSTARPSTLVEVAPLAWDGGLQLPGESLSRYRGAKPAPVAQPAAPVFETVEEHPAPEHETHAPVAAQEVTPEVVFHAPEPTPEAPAVEAAAEPIAEYEPTEASASYLVDPTAPSAYRQSSVVEPEPAAEPEITTLVEESVTAPVGVTPVAHTQSHPVELVEETIELQPSDEQSSPTVTPEESSTTVSEESIEDSDDDTSIHAFAPGSGVLEEELIDEEEDDVSPSYALLDENELDELVEETLDVQMDSGLLSDMVRDAHIEERTRFNENPNGHIADDVDDESLEDAADLGEEDIEEDGDLDEDEESLESDENSDAIAEDSGEGASGQIAARPAQQRDRGRGRGRQNNRRRTGGQGGGQGRRATAQMTNMPAINDLLKSGQEILVQIAKEPIARKGARITSHIALPGRFLVFMPTVNHVGVSRKISSDEERQRLKRILISEKGDAGGGFIVRTAAATASEEDLRADIRFLLNLWADIKNRSEASKPPALIYHDLSLVERVLRDQVSENFSTIWVDTEADYERVLRFLQRFQPSLIRRVKLYTKETPLFEQFGIQEEINKALHSKVWLKSGGSIVINQTEALVAIDINTGKYVGKTARLEDTILKTNLDAIPEIVRQIRLRDLGGIIVIDFIDMDERKNRNRVMQALEEELHNDRAPSKVLQFNDFGLVAITRKRVKQSLERTLSTQCAICTGTGMVKSPITVCNEIYIELRKMHRHLDKGDVMLRVHPEVVKHLKSNSSRWLSEMEELSGKTIIVKSDPSLHPEQFDIH